MRTTIKIFVALIIIGAGFGTYWWFQPAMHIDLTQRTPIGPAATRPSATASGTPFLNGDGDSVWVKQYDEQGRISYQFKADEYIPLGGGNVNVKKPRSVFFFKGKKQHASSAGSNIERRSRLEIDGVDGNITVQNIPEVPKDGLMKKEEFGHGAMQPPRRGKLHQVVIRLYDDENAEAKDYSLKMVTDNIAFDNETFRIFTEGYVDSATSEKVTADRVKVDVTGTQYDFVGYGLTVRWNDLDQRLEMLKIHHGECLTIKDRELLNSGSFGPKKATAAADESDISEESVVVAGPPAPQERSVNPDVILVEDLPAKGKRGKKDRGSKQAEGAPPAPKSPATKSATTRTVKPPAPPYHAVFSENVVVKQGDETIAVSDLLNVDFLMDSGKRSSSGSTTRPTTAPTSMPATTAAVTQPTTVPAPTGATTAPSTVLAQVAATRPATTAPLAEPIRVFWHGPLIITPAAVPAELTLGPGEVSLQFVGQPAILTREGSEVKCATATYRSGDNGQMDLHNSSEFPKVLIRQVAKDAKDSAAVPATIITDWAEYSLLTKVATLHGPSEAHIPIPLQSNSDAATQPIELAGGKVQMMDAKWTDWAAFHLSGSSESQMSIEHADFAGDVDIQHPQMKLKSQHLELAFDPSDAIKTADPSTDAAATSSVNLKRALATDTVWCELSDAKGKKQTIVSDRLELKTAISDDGKMYPQIVDATGKVKANDGTQELSAGHVVLTLAPIPELRQASASPEDAVADADNRAVVPSAPDSMLSAGGGIELRTMVATEAVSVRSADGATAVGDSLNVSAEPGANGQTTVTLVGAPARVVDASENVITGPTIIIHPKEGTAKIQGAGSMDATQRADATVKATTKPTEAAKGSRPLHVTWADSAIVNGPRSRIEASGNVVAKTTDPDGRISTASGERVVVVMVDKVSPVVGATTQKVTTSPAVVVAKAPTTMPADAASSQFKMELFKDKEVGSVVLLDKEHAIINSNLTAADGTLLSETQLQATSMRFQPRDGQMLIPVPGEMLVRDHRPEEKPSETKTPSAQPGAGADGRGDTAFKWSKSLAYNQNQRRAVMAGNVVIVHKPEAAKEKPGEPAKGPNAPNPADPVRVNADWVAADFEPNDTKAPKPADGNAEPSALHLKALTAVGNISIIRSNSQLLAQRIVYNPQTGWITATGTERNPATFTDLTTGQSTTAAEIWWNSQTWDVRFKNISTRATGR